jgi:hypothetical protein
MVSGPQGLTPMPAEVRRDADGETTHGLVRLRAVTEAMG